MILGQICNEVLSHLPKICLYPGRAQNPMLVTFWEHIEDYRGEIGTSKKDAYNRCAFIRNAVYMKKFGTLGELCFIYLCVLFFHNVFFARHSWGVWNKNRFAIRTHSWKKGGKYKKKNWFSQENVCTFMEWLKKLEIISLHNFSNEAKSRAKCIDDSCPRWFIDMIQSTLF